MPAMACDGNDGVCVLDRGFALPASLVLETPVVGASAAGVVLTRFESASGLMLKIELDPFIIPACPCP